MHYLNAFKPFVLRVPLNSSPTALYQHLYWNRPGSFVYESLETNKSRGRYSFVGGKPLLTLSARGEAIRLEGDEFEGELTGNPLDLIRELLKDVIPPDVRPFPGGALGYLSYDGIRYIETIPDANPSELHVPDALFLFPGEIILFDHLNETIDLVVYDRTDGKARLAALARAVKEAAQYPQPVDDGHSAAFDIQSNMTKSEFCDRVERVKAYIHAGDVFQVVLSQRLSFPVDGDPMNLFLALRETNPSPYMYFLDLDGFHILGSSPEILVKCNSGKAVNRPLAGTRPRGLTETEDAELEQDLLADEKERAEHVMLVDLARSDLGRVCRPGSVQTPQLMAVERFSRVMHLVSTVEGQLREDADAIDLVKASFPAGTVSGSPKIRAMEIIDELEPVRRDVYAGAIGYFSYGGDADLCIAIRTLVVKDEVGYLQAGAGIVADSHPPTEYQETLNKAGALVQALTGPSQEVL